MNEDQIHSALEREIDMVEDDHAQGDISDIDRDRKIVELERQARDELRDFQDRYRGHDQSDRR